MFKEILTVNNKITAVQVSERIRLNNGFTEEVIELLLSLRGSPGHCDFIQEPAHYEEDPGPLSLLS